MPHGSGRGGWPQLKEEAGGGKKSEAEKEAEQVAELIAKAHLAADAEERLAKAAGVSSAALRQAANDNKVAAFAQEHGATAAARYRVEIERASDAEQRRQINATVLGLTQQADAAERVAAAQGHGAAAAHLATLQNQAFAEALKVGAAGSKEFKVAYDTVLEQLQRKDAADTLAGFNEELQARQDALAVDQKQLSLMDQSAGKRAELVASLQEELRLRQQFPGLTQEQIDQLTQLSAADAKVKAQIKEREEAERDFALIARQGISDVVGGLKEVVQGAKTWREALLGVAQSFGKIAEQQLVEKPLSQAIDRWFSGERHRHRSRQERLRQDRRIAQRRLVLAGRPARLRRHACRPRPDHCPTRDGDGRRCFRRIIASRPGCGGGCAQPVGAAARPGRRRRPARQRRQGARHDAGHLPERARQHGRDDDRQRRAGERQWRR